MGCFLTKQSEEKFEVMKETKLFDVPCWEMLEWENLLRKNDLSMDQTNLEFKQNILSEQECVIELRTRNLEVNEGNLEDAQMMLIEE